jgi:REP element-mobilizing transposase RayT
MPRKPRVQFPGAIYHIVTRGDGQRGLFHDEDHYDRLTKGLADEVNRSRWEVLAFCWMPNHIHLLLTTPEPNLSYEALLGAWMSEFGGRNAATS